jgi:hypothetical protein
VSHSIELSMYSTRSRALARSERRRVPSPVITATLLCEALFFSFEHSVRLFGLP